MEAGKNWCSRWNSPECLPCFADLGIHNESHHLEKECTGQHGLSQDDSVTDHPILEINRSRLRFLRHPLGLRFCENILKGVLSGMDQVEDGGGGGSELAPDQGKVASVSDDAHGAKALEIGACWCPVNKV